MLTMTQIDYIRKAFFEEGLNQPLPKAKRVTEQPKLDSFKAVIDTWLTEDLKHRRKQQHTARRVFD